MLRISKKQPGFFLNIEKETVENTDFRRVLFTTHNSQLVLMSLKPGEDIGVEVHAPDQFFRFESGEGKVIIEGTEYKISDGDSVTVPSGSKHNIINTSTTEHLKLYAIYSPPQHDKDTVHKTKADASEEHFNGKVD